MTPFDRNFWLNVAEGGLFAAGLSLFSLQVILPAWLTQLGAPPVLLGVLGTLWFVGYASPQLFAAEAIRPLAYRQRWILHRGVWQRLPWLALAAVAWGSADSGSHLIPATFAAVTVYVVMTGLANPAWLDLLTKLTPAGRRGRLFGYSLLLGGLLSVGAAWGAARVLAAWPFPRNYALLFASGFALQTLSWLCFAGLQEHTPSIPAPRRPSREAWRDLLRVLRTDRKFFRFLLTAPVVWMAVFMPAAFFVSAGLRLGVMAPSHVGGLAAVLAVSQMGWSAALGWLGDHWGFHRVTGVACGLAVAASVSGVCMTWHVGWLYAAVACSAGAMSGMTIAFTNVPLLLAPSTHTAHYAALTSQFLEAAGAVGPLIGGLLVSFWGDHAMFSVAAAWALGALALVGWLQPATDSLPVPVRPLAVDPPR